MEETIFERAWGKTEDEFDAEEKELRKNELKRQFESDFDKATDAILKLKKDQNKMIKENFKNFCLNNWRENVQLIKDHEAAKDDIAAQYQDFFGEELKRSK